MVIRDHDGITYTYTFETARQWVVPGSDELRWEALFCVKEGDVVRWLHPVYGTGALPALEVLEGML